MTTLNEFLVEETSNRLESLTNISKNEIHRFDHKIHGRITQLLEEYNDVEEQLEKIEEEPDRYDPGARTAHMQQVKTITVHTNSNFNPPTFLIFKAK